jgi:A/G-specific adenine glycosylase
VAEILLQKTSRWKVEPYWAEIVTRYPNVSALSRAEVASLEQLIAPLGLIRRAATLVALARTLVERHSGEIPRSAADLIALPGVGAYVASAVRCFAFGESEPMLDSVTVRVVKRFFGLPGRADYLDAASHSALLSSIPEDASQVRRLNMALLDIAGTLCRPIRPRCVDCPLATACRSVGKTYTRATWRLDGAQKKTRSHHRGGSSLGSLIQS